MSNNHPRMVRERKTIKYDSHLLLQTAQYPKGKLCADCNELLDYAQQRLDKCPFQEGKTTCENCPKNCYKPDTRAKIGAVTRYAGPRMPYRHSHPDPLPLD